MTAIKLSRHHPYRLMFNIKHKADKGPIYYEKTYNPCETGASRKPVTGLFDFYISAIHNSPKRCAVIFSLVETVLSFIKKSNRFSPSLKEKYNPIING